MLHAISRTSPLKKGAINVRKYSIFARPEIRNVRKSDTGSLLQQVANSITDAVYKLPYIIIKPPAG